MAREAGLADGMELDREIAEFERFAKLVAAAEREACANLLLSTDLSGLSGNLVLQNYTATLLAKYVEAIRARGNND